VNEKNESGTPVEFPDRLSIDPHTIKVHGPVEPYFRDKPKT
jgi:hypothetical protein